MARAALTFIGGRDMNDSYEVISVMSMSGEALNLDLRLASALNGNWVPPPVSDQMRKRAFDMLAPRREP